MRQVFAPDLLAARHLACHRAGDRGVAPPALSRLGDLQPKEPVQRHEREAPGELLHIDIKKLGRFERTGHRITGDRTQTTRGIGWEFLFVAIDDHSRIAFTQMYPDERKESVVSFVQAAPRTSPSWASPSSG